MTELIGHCKTKHNHGIKHRSEMIGAFFLPIFTEVTTWTH